MPLWDLSASGGVFTMDAGDDPDGSGITGGDVYSILMANFEESYSGNRCATQDTAEEAGATCHLSSCPGPLVS